VQSAEVFGGEGGVEDGCSWGRREGLCGRGVDVVECEDLWAGEVSAMPVRINYRNE
jgi:hypothetical protein